MDKKKLEQLAVARSYITKDSYRRASEKRTKPIGERFPKYFAKSGEDECWPWTGSKDKRGYGKISDGNRLVAATHIALILDGRPRPTNGHVACHRCDNPPCVNPDHLWWGTRKENQQDMVSKGRNGKKGSPKISEDDVRYIRKSKEKTAYLSKVFGISRSQVLRIKNKKTWANLPD